MAGVLLLLLAVTVAGCNRTPPRLTIQGSVSYRGQPVPSGRVRFLTPDKQHTWMADLKSDGTFVITDVAPGEVKVAIQDDPRAPKGKTAKPAAELAPGESPGHGPSVVIPEKYKDVDTSELKYDITPSTRDLKIDLK
jgi:hypothetical protein